jgi:hypothetical protein
MVFWVKPGRAWRTIKPLLILGSLIALKLVASNTIIRPQKFTLLLVAKTMLLSETTPAITSKY